MIFRLEIKFWFSFKCFYNLIIFFSTPNNIIIWYIRQSIHKIFNLFI